MAELAVSVISPEKVMFEGTARMVVATAYDGEVGILPLHAPLMTLLGTGPLRIDAVDGTQRRFAVAGGFLQVVDNHVRIVADRASAE